MNAKSATQDPAVPVSAPAGSTTTAPADGQGMFSRAGQPSIFPTRESQVKWRFAHDDRGLRLFDGEKVYAFELPDGLAHDKPVTARQKEIPVTEFAGGTEGPVQVHHSNPGTVYFTLQEGRSNPTFTLQHHQGDEWRLIPKPRRNPIQTKVRQVRRLADLIMTSQRKTAAAPGMADAWLREHTRTQAAAPPPELPVVPPPRPRPATTIPDGLRLPNPVPVTATNLPLTVTAAAIAPTAELAALSKEVARLKTEMQKAPAPIPTTVARPGLLNLLLGGAQRTAQLPGEMHANWFGGRHNAGLGLGGNLAVGAGLGLLYDQARRRWYNTEEENLQENQNRKRTLALRTGVPALALSLLGAVQGSMHADRYSDLRTGAGEASRLF